MTIHYGTNEGLTKQDIKCLRAADFICLDWYNNESGIRAIKDNRSNNNGFNETHYINGIETRFDIYLRNVGDSMGTLDEFPISCYAHIWKYEHTKIDGDIVHTFLDFIKVGDVLSIHWIASGNDYVKQAQLYHDRAYITVKRKNKKYKFFM
jgi:hypothetical protein